MKELLRQYICEILGSQDFEKTYQTASRVHQDQRRRSGEAYFEHPKEVRNIVRRYYPTDRVAQLAALLHDTLEDYEKGGVYKTEAEVLDQIDASIRSPEIKKEVISVVSALTHDKSIPYTEYVISLSNYQAALRVKLADMLHNLSSSPSDKQKTKYGSAIIRLISHHNGNPPGVSAQHISDLLTLSGVKINESKSKKKKQSAGFIIVRSFDEGWRVLGLRLWGSYDLPKGRVEKDDQGDLFKTAQRECFEECAVSVDSSDLKWGNSSIQLKHVTIFLAETTQDPIIRKNIKSGIYEHHSAEWLTWDDLAQKIHGYLGPAVGWARNIVDGSEL